MKDSRKNEAIISKLETGGVILLFFAPLLTLNVLFIDREISDLEQKQSRIFIDLDIYRSFQIRDLDTYNSNKIFEKLPNVTSKELGGFEKLHTDFINGMGRSLIFALGNDAPINYSQFSNLSPTEKNETLDFLGKSIEEKYNQSIDDINEKKELRSVKLTFAFIFQALGFILFESSRFCTDSRIAWVRNHVKNFMKRIEKHKEDIIDWIQNHLKDFMKRIKKDKEELSE